MPQTFAAPSTSIPWDLRPLLSRAGTPWRGLAEVKLSLLQCVLVLLLHVCEFQAV